MELTEFIIYYNLPDSCTLVFTPQVLMTMSFHFTSLDVSLSKLSFLHQLHHCLVATLALSSSFSQSCRLFPPLFKIQGLAMDPVFSCSYSFSFYLSG